MKPRPENRSGGRVTPESRGNRHEPADLPPRAKADELKLCGLAAVRARFARDAGSIRRLYFDYATGRKVGVMCKALAAAKKVYRCVEPPELEKIAGTVHHGGIVAVVPAPIPVVPTDADLVRWSGRKEPVLVLDRIGNPHNLGALARTAGFLGLAHLVIPDDPAAAQPSDAAYRVAEGGFEAVHVAQCGPVAPFLRRLAAAGFEIVGAATRGGQPQSSASPAARPIALVLGNEEHGLASDVAAACHRLVTIPGEGGVESLNVSVAGAILMWELFARSRRRH